LNRSDDGNDSLSNDYNNVRIIAMIGIYWYILYIRYVGIGKLVVGDHNELVMLPRAAAAAVKGEAVSIPELKMAIAKALGILIAKLDIQQTSKEGILQDMT
jgi:hypothetical protein